MSTVDVSGAVTDRKITMGTLALLEHPDQLALLRESDDPKLLASAVEELLRYLTITHGGLFRVALEDIEIAGQVIRAGDGLIIVNETANRDPAVYGTLYRRLPTDPTRIPFKHDGFIYGVYELPVTW